MSSRQSTWRVTRATNYRDLRGHNVTLTYDERGLGLAVVTPPAALSVAWFRCRTRLTRRSNTWELTIAGTPWGDLTLTTFRPVLTPGDLTFWEAHGVVWSRWRWNRLAAATLVLAVLSYAGIAMFMERHSVVRILQRSQPTAEDFPFAATIDTASSPLSRVMTPANVVMQKGLQLDGPVTKLPRRVLDHYVACTGIASSRDRVLGKGSVTPAGVVYSSIFRSTSDTTFRVGALSEIFSDASEVRRATRQLERTGVPECVAATYARLVMRAGGQTGRIVGVDPMAMTVLGRASIHAARATIVVAGERSVVYVALVTDGRIRVTVIGSAQHQSDSLFTQSVATVGRKVSGDAVAAA